ncbi:MAG TPA: DnaJ domain-containing protein [Burkholderiales bacterium]|nr:DnaJ domain-containing protein [Burkholderiales bacterium]
MKKTLYEILGVDPGASMEEIAAAYKQRLQELSVATIRDPNKLVILNQARDILSDATHRAAYDASLAAPAASPAHTDDEEDPTLLQSWGKWIAAGVAVIAIGLWFTSRGTSPPAETPLAPLPQSVAEEAPDMDDPVVFLDEPAESAATQLETTPPAADEPQQDASVHPIVGEWSCFDPVSGLSSDYDFQADGTVGIELAGSAPRSLKYQVSGSVLRLSDPAQTSTYTIEELTARRLLLNTGVEGRRLVCSR